MSVLLAGSQQEDSLHDEHSHSSRMPDRIQLLRLSITDLCNFRCCYCMPPEGVPKLAHSDLLSYERIVELVNWLTGETNIHRVRLTGGEPLVRPEIETLIRKLAALPKIDEVALTTNASLLTHRAQSLKAAGLSRLNISLDSLDTARFAEITRGGNLQSTLDGIEAAKQSGLTPIKINAVLQRSTWRSEVPRLLDFAQTQGFEIRFIEMMHTGTEQRWCESEYVSVDEVRSGLHAEILPWDIRTRSAARKSQLKWNGEYLTVGWITPRSHPFCGSCERLRMDARGRLRRCLMDPSLFHLQSTLDTQDAQDAGIAFRHYIAGKLPPTAMDSPLAMSQIGG